MARKAETVENCLGEARKAAGYTQQQAAEVSGFTLSQIRRWEQGANEPDMAALIRLADVYGVTTDQLLGVETYSMTNGTDGIPDFDSVIYRSDADVEHLVDLYCSMTVDGRARLIEQAEMLAAKYSRD